MLQSFNINLFLQNIKMNIINLKDKSSNSFNPFLSNNSHLITTPYEKVLLTIKEAIKCITNLTKTKNKLISDLQWVIKIISNHLLYSYEIKESSLVSQLTKENPDLKQFVDFVTEYNDQIIEMNKKNIIIGVKNVEVSNRFLQKNSFKLKRQLLQNNKNNNIISHNRANSNDLYNYNIKNNISNIFNTNNNTNNQFSDSKINVNKSAKKKITIDPINLNEILNKNYIKNIPIQKPLLPKLDSNRYNSFNNNNVHFIHSNNNYNHNDNKIFNTFNYYVNLENNNRHSNREAPKIIVNYNSKNKISLKKITQTNPNTVLTNLFNKVNNNISNNNINNNNILITDPNKPNNKPNNYLQKFSYIYIDHLLTQYNFDKKSILTNDFNIFELKKIIGYENVLPLLGMVILEGLGLKDEKIISLNKLEPFLQKVSSSYLTTTIYHNSMHGSDVTHSTALFFLNSNAEKIIQTNVLDLLSIIIASLGHDVGHPGLTNNYHVNALTELAIVYNDISCLENYHSSTLFSILRYDDFNIFEKLNKKEFKTIRKRMISEILATDMANHNKVVSLVQEHSPINEEKIDENFVYLSGDDKTKFDEQQYLLDYFIHAADLGHNTKKFEFSIQWVELLTNEFWLQGDKERKLNLPISFLCDRINVDIPTSQVGFIGGIILPTFGYLIKMFPSLNYTVENAKRNLSKWKKLVEEHREKGWTPRGERDKKKEKEISNGKLGDETVDNSDEKSKD